MVSALLAKIQLKRSKKNILVGSTINLNQRINKVIAYNLFRPNIIGNTQPSVSQPRYRSLQNNLTALLFLNHYKLNANYPD